MRDAPVYNTLKHAHELLLETMLAQQRYFRPGETPSQALLGIVEDFFAVWKFAETDFGLRGGTTEIIL